MDTMSYAEFVDHFQVWDQRFKWMNKRYQHTVRLLGGTRLGNVPRMYHVDIAAELDRTLADRRKLRESFRQWVSCVKVVDKAND